MWREYIQSLGVKADFATPASEQRIARAAGVLGVGFPEDLVALLRETNGWKANLALVSSGRSNA